MDPDWIRKHTIVNYIQKQLKFVRIKSLISGDFIVRVSPVTPRESASYTYSIIINDKNKL